MNRRMRQWSTVLVAMIVLTAVIFFTRHLIAQQLDHSAPPQVSQSQRPDVAVIAVDSAAYNARVSGYGETESHFALTLTAQISGQVMEQSEMFESGCKVSKGAVLVQLDGSDY